MERKRLQLRRRPITDAVDELTQRSTATQHGQSDQGTRVVGQRSRIGKVVRERAAATGLLPHEILLMMARGEPYKLRVVNQETGETQIREMYPDLGTIVECAKAASPYFAPKLSAVQTVTGASDEELDEFIKSAAAEAGISLGATGEAEASADTAGEGGAEPDSEGE